MMMNKKFRPFLKNVAHIDGNEKLNEVYIYNFFYPRNAKEYNIWNKLNLGDNIKRNISNNLLIFLHVRKNLIDCFNSKQTDHSKYFENIKWSNIESDLKDFLDEKSDWYYKKYIDSLKEYVLSKHSINDDIVYFFNYLEEKLIILESLKNSLIYFENEFANYISNKLLVCKKNKYNKNSFNIEAKWFHILNYLIQNKYIDIESCKNYLLSFNYTYTNKDDLNNYLTSKLKTKFEWISYVHGIADSKLPTCIIGIDDMFVEVNKFKEFTKSYQIITHYNRDNDEWNELYFNIPLLLKPDYKKIKLFFYGHSLSRNDWSYFFAIFDKYKLLEEQKMSLYFLYSADDSDNRSSKYCDYKDIYNLIYFYAKSKKIEEIGKNLFTRLIIEGRIKILFI